MAKFFYNRDALACKGVVIGYVEASTLEEAKLIVDTGSIMVEEQVVVTEVGDVVWEEEEE